MSDCEIAIVGAGPYGLAVAAHLKAAGFSPRVFGETMSFWRRHMPKGMMLRSSSTNTDIGSVNDSLSFRAYADKLGLHAIYPMPLGEFIRYGEWYQAQAVPELDTRRIDRIERKSEQFLLHLHDGEQVRAKRVVIATGLANQEFRPSQFDGLPKELTSHTCEHDDLAHFGGKRVAVIGYGQSACETAAILKEVGAEVELIGRRDLHWLGAQRLGAQTGSETRKHGAMALARKLLSSKSGVGPFPLNQIVEHPNIVRMLKPGMRAALAARCMRPGASSWIQPRLDGVRLHPNQSVQNARPVGSQIMLKFAQQESAFDHVMLATGYHVDCSKLGLFDPDILGNLAQVDGSPDLGVGFESSIPGLHFVGASAIQSYGPIMRFVSGSKFTATHLTRILESKKRSQPIGFRRMVSAKKPGMAPVSE